MSFLNPKEYDVNTEQLPKGLFIRNVFWIVLLFTVLVSLLFKFPIQESLEGRVEIFHNGVPISVVAKTNARLTLYVDDQEYVEESELLGFYDWKVSKSDMQTLSEIAKLNYTNSSDTSGLKLNELIASLDSDQIPFVQGNISSISAALSLYQGAIEQRGFSGFVAAQNQRITSLEKNKSINQAVIDSKEKQLKVLEEHMASDLELLERGILSRRDFELKKREYEKEVIEIQSGALSIGVMDDDIQDIKSSIQLGRYNLLLVELENYKALLNALEEYKQAFYRLKEEKEIVAPSSGTIFISDVIRFSQEVQSGEEILTIKPTDKTQESLARIITGPESIGRVKIGDRVMISLEAYPVEQYGVLYAQIANTRDIPQGEGYIFDLSLKNGLETSYKKDLKPLSSLTGMGNIMINRTNIYEIVKDQIMATKTRLQGASDAQFNFTKN